MKKNKMRKIKKNLMAFAIAFPVGTVLDGLMEFSSLPEILKCIFCIATGIGLIFLSLNLSEIILRKLEE